MSDFFKGRVLDLRTNKEQTGALIDMSFIDMMKKTLTKVSFKERKSFVWLEIENASNAEELMMALESQLEWIKFTVAISKEEEKPSQDGSVEL